MSSTDLAKMAVNEITDISGSNSDKPEEINELIDRL
jgi:hypothetical protein